MKHKRLWICLFSLLLVLCAQAMLRSAPESFILEGAPPLQPPRGNLLAWYNGNDGTNATATVGTNAPIVQRNAITLDGVDDVIICYDTSVANLVVNSTTAFSIEFTANLDALDNFDCIMGNFSTSVNGWRIDQPFAGGLSFFCYDGAGYAVNISKGTGWHTYRMERNTSDQYTWYIDGVAQVASTDSLSGAGFTHNCTRGFQIGRRNFSPYADFQLAYIKIVYGGTTQLEYVCEEGAGSIVYDVSGNGNHGTITGGTWTKVDGVSSYQAVYGFTKSGSVYIPALPDGSADALGNPITNPGGYVHNGGGYSLLLNGVTNSYADLQLWERADGGPIRNALIYSAEPVTTNRANLYCDVFDGVWTNTAP